VSTFTYDVTNDVGKVRLDVWDFDLTVTTGAREDWTCCFTDEEITSFLDRAFDSIYMADCLALHSISNSKALLSIRRKMGDYDEDLTNISIQLRQQAKEFQDLAKAEMEIPADAVAEVANDEFSARQIRRNRAMRESM
jgi:hypothetical protein